MNCITQQQPASAKFLQKCGWMKVQVAAQNAILYSAPAGGSSMGSVPRVTASGDNVYLKTLSSWGNRTLVLVVGEFKLNGRIGWVNEDDIESAGEKCPSAYSIN